MHNSLRSGCGNSGTRSAGSPDGRQASSGSCDRHGASTAYRSMNPRLHTPLARTGIRGRPPAMPAARRAPSAAPHPGGGSRLLPVGDVCRTGGSPRSSSGIRGNEKCRSRNARFAARRDCEFLPPQPVQANAAPRQPIRSLGRPPQANPWCISCARLEFPSRARSGLHSSSIVTSSACGSSRPTLNGERRHSANDSTPARPLPRGGTCRGDGEIVSWPAHAQRERTFSDSSNTARFACSNSDSTDSILRTVSQLKCFSFSSFSWLNSW